MEGISQAHQDVVVSYLRHMRFKRAQHVHDVQASFTDLVECRYIRFYI